VPVTSGDQPRTCGRAPGAPPPTPSTALGPHQSRSPWRTHLCSVSTLIRSRADTAVIAAGLEQRKGAVTAVGGRADT
jgi:hypothetical protein